VSDTSLSTKVILSGGGSTAWGSVPVPTAAQITNAQLAIDTFNASGTSIDSLLPGGTVKVYLVPNSFFTANGWTSSGTQPWGYTPKGGVAFVSNTLSSWNQRYTIIHETFHSVDSSIGVMNHAKRVTIAGLMSPSVDTSVSGFWGKGSSPVRPSEVFADTAPAAYNTVHPSLDYYTRKIPSGSYAAYRSAISGATLPASTTLAAAASAGATNIKVVSVSGLVAGDWLLIGGVEYHQITTVGTAGSGGSGVTLTSALSAGYASGATVVETAPQSDVLDGAIDIVVNANTINGATRSHTITGLAPGASGSWQMRYYDGKAWGPWSDPVAAVLGILRPPKNLTVTPGTLTPDLGASLDSTFPGDYIKQYWIHLWQQTTTGLVALMDTGVVDLTLFTTRINVSYSGNIGGPLAWDQRYVWTCAFKNSQDVWTPQAAFAYFTPTVDVGPYIRIGSSAGPMADGSSKIDTLTPTFNVADRGGANIDQARLWVYSSADVPLWDSGVVSFASAANRNITVPANILQWGMDPKVAAAVRVTGNVALGVATDTPIAVHINNQPGAPSPVSITAAATDQVVLRPDGVWVTTAGMPTAVFPYLDKDKDDLGFTDNPTRREVEIRNAADAHVFASPYVITTGITNNFVMPALTAETTYKIRARYDDAAAVRSAFSAYVQVKYSLAPTLSGVTPAPDAVVTDPTPAIAWAYASSAGKAQAGYAFNASVNGDTVYDTGFVASGATGLSIPPFVLPNGVTVAWTLLVYDSDMLYARYDSQFTTSFTAPAVPTGLVLTPDTAQKAIVATWDVSALSAGEFLEYRVYARGPNGQFRLVKTISDQSATSYTYREAAHNAESIVRVTQSNGFGESDPIEASATLGTDPNYIPGYWILTESDVVELLNVEQFGPGDTNTRLERMSPLAAPGERAYDVVLDWGTGGYETSFRVFTYDRDLLRTLRRYKEAGQVVLLKTEYGDSRYGRLTSTPDNDEPNAWARAAVSFVETEPANF
jgi:hypothetical protein